MDTIEDFSEVDEVKGKHQFKLHALFNDIT